MINLKPIVFLFSASCAINLSCTRIDYTMPIKANVDVYLAGAKLNGTDTTWTATYWKNGSPVSVTNGKVSSYLFGIAVSNGNIFVAGYEGNSLKYWKNGVAVSLGDGVYAKAMAVSGDDVYLAGGFTPDSACYWKNGRFFSLQNPDSLGSIYATSIAVSGTDVYVTGFQVRLDARQSFLWINGQIVFSTPEVITSIAITPSARYMVGYSSTNPVVALYWNNNSEVQMTGTGSFKANFVTTSGSDVYVAGLQDHNGNKVATYWKNGTPVALTDGAQDQDGYSIAVAGNDVYVTSKGLTNKSSMLWKNGSPVAPFDGTSSRYYAYGLFVDGK